MKPLEKKLINLGLSTHRYGYRSLMQPIAVHSENLHQYLTQTHDVNRPINLVGHSLGGLVIRHFWQIILSGGYIAVLPWERHTAAVKLHTMPTHT